MACIDLYMVRAGVVALPSAWRDGGYREIQHRPERYRVIDTGMLMSLLGVSDAKALAGACRQRVESALCAGKTEREAHWTESVAVGSRAFVMDVKKHLWPRGNGRVVIDIGAVATLREMPAYYGDFVPENAI